MDDGQKHDHRNRNGNHCTEIKYSTDNAVDHKVLDIVWRQTGNQ